MYIHIAAICTDIEDVCMVELTWSANLPMQMTRQGVCDCS